MIIFSLTLPQINTSKRSNPIAEWHEAQEKFHFVFRLEASICLCNMMTCICSHKTNFELNPGAPNLEIFKKDGMDSTQCGTMAPNAEKKRYLTGAADGKYSLPQKNTR